MLSEVYIQNSNISPDQSKYFFYVILDTAEVTIIIPSLTTSAPPTSTERYRTFLEDTRNAAWLTCIIIFGVVTLSVMIYTAYKFEILKKIVSYWQEFIQKRKEA